MKKTTISTAALLASLGIWVGCATSSPETSGVTLTPSHNMLMPDAQRQITADMQFHVPAHYFNRRSRLVITPQLMLGDSTVEEYLPLVVDAPIYSKKRKRKEQLLDYVDIWGKHAQQINTTSKAFDLVYHDRLQLPEQVEGGQLIAVVSTDGCGHCTSLDTISMGQISNPVSLMTSHWKEEISLPMMKHTFVVRPKVMNGKGVAHLQFVINRYDINLQMGNNAAELNQMVGKLSPILRDTLSTLTSLSIYGMASADGSLSFNTTLSRNRAQSAKNWLVKELQLPAETQQLITVDSRPEGWMPVLNAMIAGGHPDSTAVRNILEKYADRNDDVQEYHIRRLSCWNDIKDHYLQKDRKVEYVYTYTLKSFTTDTELLKMFDQRPDAFNEDEMLRVATLKMADKDKQAVYEKILTYFPNSKIAANNLAALYLRQERHAEALNVLSRQNELSPELLSKKAAAYLYADDYEHAVELLQQIDLPEARYNLGLLRAQQRHLKEAYELLRPFGDLNSAILALCMNQNEEANQILRQLDDHRPIALYVRAMTAARLQDAERCYTALREACRDQGLRERAKSEPEFESYRSQARFQELLTDTASKKKGAEQ